jgi:hypothetical protein
LGGSGIGKEDLVSRLVIDAHVHPQRFTPGFLKVGEQFTYDKLENAIIIEEYECPPRT